MWLHSSVGRASHRYRRGHGFESRWSPDFFFFFFRLLLSNCLNWKIYCDDYISLSSTTAVQIWIISYKLHIILIHVVTIIFPVSINIWNLSVNSGISNLNKPRGGMRSNLLLWPFLVSDHFSLATTFSKYQKFLSQITINRISRQRECTGVRLR